MVVRRLYKSRAQKDQHHRVPHHAPLQHEGGLLAQLEDVVEGAVDEGSSLDMDTLCTLAIISPLVVEVADEDGDEGSPDAGVDVQITMCKEGLGRIL